jgi:FkbM family methyltransferase
MPAPSPPSTSPLRALRRRARALLPPDRRVKPLGNARGRWKVQARKLLAPVAQRPVTITSREGLRLELDTDPVDELVANDLLGRNRTLWFPDAPEGALPLVEPSLVLDLGAHHGFFAVAALHRWPTARLIAVEPSGAGVARIARNLALNGMSERVRIVQAALADGPGWGRLHHTDEGSWGASLFREEGATVLGEEPVRLDTLEGILAGEEPDAIKCNAEGAEFALIRALVATGLRPEQLVVMVHPEFGDLDAAVADVERCGYVVRLAGTGRRPVIQAWLPAANPTPG